MKEIKLNNNINKIILFFGIVLFILFGNKSFAADSMVNTVEELKVAIENASGGDTITLASGFVLEEDSIIQMPSENIRIDGNNNIFSSGNLIINGDGSGNITIKNLEIDGSRNDSKKSAITIDTKSGATVILERIYIHNNTSLNTASAIRLGENANVDINNSTIEKNIGTGGGYETGAISSKNYIGTLNINNTVFRNNINKTSNTGVTGGGGGAIAIHYFFGKITITESIFDGNKSSGEDGNVKNTYDGGAIYVLDGRDGAVFNIDKSTFMNNIAYDDGGAIMFQGTGNPGLTTNINNSTFYNNKAYGLDGMNYAGGAIQYFKNGGSAKMTNSIYSSTFVKNQAGNEQSSLDQRGGAIGNSGAGIFAMAVVSRFDSLFIGNEVYGKSGKILEESSYKNISNYQTVQAGTDNVINVDATVPPKYSVKDILGVDKPILSDNQSGIEAGYVPEIIQTIPIKPEGIADNTYSMKKSISSTDQRGAKRFKDQGAVEMSWIKYDANGGFYDVSKDKLPPFIGEQYYNTNNVEKILEYFTIGKNNEETTVYQPKYLKHEEGKKFLGWSTDKDATESDSKYNIGNKIDYMDENFTLYAVWEKFTVDYDANGGSGEVPVDKNKYDKDEEVIIKYKGNLTNENLVFIGWNTQKDGKGVNYAEGSTLKIKENTKLYATWSKPLRVTYDGNGADSGAIHDTGLYVEGDTVTVLDNNKDTGFKKDHHKFIGWNTKADGSGQAYAVGETFKIKDNTCLYAQWQEEDSFTVTYDINGGKGEKPIDSKKYYSEMKVIVLDGEGLEKENHKFIGWNTEPDGSGDNYEDRDEFIIKGNTTLYANWKELEKFTITYDGNGNSSGTAPIDKDSPYYEGTLVKFLDKGNLGKSGYKFKHWNTEPDGSGTSYNPGDSQQLTYNATLYAIWIKDGSGETINPPDPTNPTEPVKPIDPEGTIKEITLIGGKSTLTERIDKQLSNFKRNRIAGEDRYETSVEVSKTYKNSEIVLLASGEKYTDELTATVLANKLEAPIMLTAKDNVPNKVKKEIKRLGAEKVVLIGGDSSVSKEVERELSSYEIERIGGTDRYKTATLVGEQIREITGSRKEAILVDGTNFPDAIAMTSMGVEQEMPILLTSPKKLEESTEKTIKDWGLEKITIGGGKRSVSETIEKKLKEKTKVDRISGKDRYETSVLVAKQVYKNPEHIVVASGEVFPDAIVGAPYAAKNKYPIVLSQKNIIPEVVVNYISSK